MANILKMSGEPGRNFYAVIRRDSDHQVWNGSAFVSWVDSNLNLYALPFTHVGGGLYVRTFPTGIASGDYTVIYFLRVGATPAVTDLRCDIARKSWDGSSFTTPGMATPEEIADAVWDEDLSTHDSTGSAGAKLDSAAAAGDPLASAVPGEYESGTAGHALGVTLPHILQGVNRINPGRVSTSAAVLESGLYIVIVRGDTYSATSPRGPLAWSPEDDSDWPNLTGATGIFTARLASTDAIEVAQAITIENPAGPDKRIMVELTAEQTAALTPSAKAKDHKFDVQIILASGDVWTPIRGGDNLSRSGGMTVIEDQSRPDPDPEGDE